MTIPSRRTFLQSAACCALGERFSGRLHAQDLAQRAPLWAGCLFDSAATASNAAGLALIDADYIRSLPFRSTTGDATLDTELNDVLLRIARTYSFPSGHWPAFQLLASGSLSGTIAFARDGITILSGTQGLIAMGLDAFNTEWQAARGPWGVEVILAHEFAHVYQVRNNYDEYLLQTNEVKWLELHADYLAGWLINRQENITIEQLKKVVDPMFRRGEYITDPALHHGTPAERFSIVLQGFLDGPSTDTIAGAAEAGRQIVRALRDG